MKKYIRCNMSLQQKIDFLRKLIYDATGIDDLVLIKKMVNRLSRYGLPEVSKYSFSRLSEQEKIVRQILEVNEISPKSAYKWLLLLGQPQSLIDLVNSGNISMNEMTRRCTKIKREIDPEHEKLGKEIIDDITKLVEAIE